MRCIGLLFVAACLVCAECVDVAQGKITARDMARVDTAWAQVPGEEELGYAPKVGAKRVVEAVELQRWAARFGVTASDAHAVCFQRVGHVWSREEIEQAVAQVKDVRVIDYSRVPTVAGDLDFQTSGLQIRPGQETALWRGFVRQADGERTPFWIRVQVTASHAEVRAAADLPAGEPIRAEQLVAGSVAGWDDRKHLESVEQAVGKIPRRSIKQGESLTSNVLQAAPAVRKGQVVEVQIATSSGLLAVQGISQSSGMVGSSVLLQNPVTAKLYRGVVTGPGVAVVKLAEAK